MYTGVLGGGGGEGGEGGKGIYLLRIQLKTACITWIRDVPEVEEQSHEDSGHHGLRHCQQLHWGAGR